MQAIFVAARIAHRHLLRLLLVVAALLACGAGSSLRAQTVTIDAMSGQSVDLIEGQGLILRFDQPAESVFVADPEIADVRVVSPGVVYLFGAKVGETNLIGLSPDQSQRGSVRVRVVGNTRAAKQAMRALEPDSLVQISLFGGKFVAAGRTKTVGEALDAGNIVETFSPANNPGLNNTTYDGANQVNIRVRFAEVSRDELQRFGLNWSAFVENGSFSFGVISGNPQGAVPGGIAAKLKAGPVNVDVLLDALQSNGILTILAEPNITAVTGQTASFLAGGEIPIPIPAGNQQIGIEYKQFGVSLQFTPTLLPNERIALQVKPEVSTVSPAGGVTIAGLSVPALRVRRADTTVEVGSGQTFAIAGLFQRQESRQIDKTPVLGDLPILGELFKSKKFQRNETELVILITPYLVTPQSARNLKTPLDTPSGAAFAPRKSKSKQTSRQAHGFYIED